MFLLPNVRGAGKRATGPAPAACGVRATPWGWHRAAAIANHPRWIGGWGEAVEVCMDGFGHGWQRRPSLRPVPACACVTDPMAVCVCVRVWKGGREGGREEGREEGRKEGREGGREGAPRHLGPILIDLQGRAASVLAWWSLWHAARPRGKSASPLIPWPGGPARPPLRLSSRPPIGGAPALLSLGPCGFPGPTRIKAGARGVRSGRR